MNDEALAKGRAGEWKLDLDISGANLAFAPDWPMIEDIDARLAFRGNGLTVEGATALGVDGVVRRAGRQRQEQCGERVVICGSCNQRQLRQ